MRLSRKARQAVIDRATEAGYLDIYLGDASSYQTRINDAQKEARLRVEKLLGPLPLYLTAVTSTSAGAYRFHFKPFYQQGVA